MQGLACCCVRLPVWAIRHMQEREVMWNWLHRQAVLWDMPIGNLIDYWVYVLTLEVNTGVCNLTRQRRLQKTTTTTTRNSTVCLCIFFTFRIFHIPHFTLRSAVLFRMPNSAFYTFAILCIPQSAFYLCPTFTVTYWHFVSVAIFHQLYCLHPYRTLSTTNIKNRL